MRLVFYFYLKVKQVPTWNRMNVLNNVKKNKKKCKYDVCVISNLSNGYIHQYWTNKPSTFASNNKCMGRYFIESKNDGENIFSSLHIVWTIFISSLSMYCVCNLLEYISLNKLLISVSASHIPFDNKS